MTGGENRGGALSDADGRFRLQAPPGDYLLRIVRIGFAPFETPLRLDPGDRLTRDFRIVSAALVLGGVEVEAERRTQCAGARCR